MKLALVIPGFQAHEDDWCIPAFTNLARELAKTLDLHVFTLRYPALRASYQVGAVRVHAIGGGSLAGGLRVPAFSLLRLWTQTFAAIEAEHEREPFDAVIGVWATESGWLAAHAARRLGVPSVVHLAGGELVWLPRIRYGNQGFGLAQALVSGALRHACMLTAPSGPIERKVLTVGRVDPAKVRRLALGVDTEMFAYRAAGQLARSGRPFTFITVGSLIAVKNHRGLLKALAEVRSRAPAARFRLVIVGSGPLLGELQRLAERLELTGYVNFAGEVRHERLPRMLADADCFVLSSYHEAQCMAALEAMARGLPWVAPPVGALADCAQAVPGEPPSGILARGWSAGALADAMLVMMDTADGERADMGEAARRRVERDYELRTQARRLAGLVAELTQQGTIDTISESNRNVPAYFSEWPECRARQERV